MERLSKMKTALRENPKASVRGRVNRTSRDKGQGISVVLLTLLLSCLQDCENDSSNSACVPEAAAREISPYPTDWTDEGYVDYTTDATGGHPAEVEGEPGGSTKCLF
jgi:hypothetical protein